MAIIAAIGLALLATAGAAAPPGKAERDGFDELYQAAIKAEPADRSAQATTPPVPAVPNAAGECHRALYNGLVLAGDYPPIDYPHQLTIQNQHGSPAFVKLVNVTTRQRTLFYVGAGQTASLTNIPDGSYSIAYASGGHLAADCDTVIRPGATMLFPGPQTFATKTSGDQIETVELSFTLYRVADGNVKPTAISVAEFNAD